MACDKCLELAERLIRTHEIHNQELRDYVEKFATLSVSLMNGMVPTQAVPIEAEFPDEPEDPALSAGVLDDS